MRSEQGESILVTGDRRLRRRFPSPHGVAAFAIRPELSPVEIGVATGTFYRSVGKNLGDVARITGYRFVHAPQGEAGLRSVVELGFRSQGSPTGLGMAVLACDGDGPVRVADGLCGGDQGQPSSYCQHPRRLYPNTNSLTQIPHCLPFARTTLSDSGELLWYLIGLICPEPARNKEKWILNWGFHLRRKPVRYGTTCFDLVSNFSAIGMAPLALQRCVPVQARFTTLQNQRFGMALSAADLLMRAFQSKLRLGVIERA